MKIGEKIRNAPEELQITQATMAKQIPMNQSNYSKIERDAQEPSLLQLKRICEILHVNPSYLLQMGEYENLSAKDQALLKDIKALIDKYR